VSAESIERLMEEVYATPDDIVADMRAIVSPAAR
jgi:hypothetical protein